MNHFFLLIHRWVGLIIAGFLVVSGLTGAVISWDHELDELLNPHLTRVEDHGPPLPILDLVSAIEARDERAHVTFVPLAAEPGESLAFGIDSHVDPTTGLLYDIGYNQVFIDPATGQELGRRDWGAVWPITKETFVSFLYKLHYSLHLPDLWGIDRWGLWLMGGIAILWALDCFVGFYLTLPARSSSTTEAPQRRWWTRWQPAWRVKTSGTRRRINFDLHRAFGLWTWGLLFMLAFTAFSLNLYRELFYPIMSLVTEVTPSPFDVRTPNDTHRPIVPRVGYVAILEQARQEAMTRGWPEPLGDVFYSQEFGIYGVRFFQPGEDHGAAGVGPPALYFDGSDGRYLGDSQPWKGTLADLFVQAQFPMHSGRILGLPGRILISIMGVGTAMLSITGVVIWWRKHTAYRRRERHRVRPLDPVSVE